MLVRRYIGKRLADYYAQPSNSVVGSMPSLESVQLSALWGEWHWRRLYQRLYNEQEGQWLTPVELFQPHYSTILANFVASEAVTCGDGDNSSEIDVVEMGGGRGTNAALLLSHLRETKPDIYDRISYTIIDSSPSLHNLQRQNLLAGEHGNKIELILKDVSDIAEKKVPFMTKSDKPTVVIALELLDNLPHDKVRRCRRTRSLEQAELRVCEEDGGISNGADKNEQLEEVFVPLSDPLLSAILGSIPFYGGKSGRPCWVPTVACGFLESLRNSRPNSTLILADFDFLPPPDLPPNNIARLTSPRRSVLADGEPLITCMDKIDYECYLESPQHCDILFPTNFSQLKKFAEKVFGDNATVMVRKQSTFLEEYGMEEVNATTSWITGFSPLVHDFGNCSILSVTQNNKTSEKDMQRNAINTML